MDEYRQDRQWEDGEGARQGRAPRTEARYRVEGEPRRALSPRERAEARARAQAQGAPDAQADPAQEPQRQAAVPSRAGRQPRQAVPARAARADRGARAPESAGRPSRQAPQRAARAARPAPEPAPARNGRGGSRGAAGHQLAQPTVPPALLLALAVLAVLVVVLFVLNVRSCSTVADVTAERDSARSQLESSRNTISALTASSDAVTTTVTNDDGTQTVETSVYTGVEDPWVAGGYYTTGNQALDQIVKQYCDDLADTSKTYLENAETVYNHVCWMEYEERDDNQNPQGPNWAQLYAIQLSVNEGGNCYELAAFISFCLQYFGLDAVAEPCIIELQSGDWGDHGLTFVKLDGQDKLCDQAFGANGWLLDASTYNYEIKDIGQH